jgi:hypothetical protein
MFAAACTDDNAGAPSLQTLPLPAQQPHACHRPGAVSLAWPALAAHRRAPAVRQLRAGWRAVGACKHQVHPRPWRADLTRRRSPTNYTPRPCPAGLTRAPVAIAGCKRASLLISKPSTPPACRSSALGPNCVIQRARCAYAQVRKPRPFSLPWASPCYRGRFHWAGRTCLAAAREAATRCHHHACPLTAAAPLHLAVPEICTAFAAAAVLGLNPLPCKHDFFCMQPSSGGNQARPA